MMSALPQFKANDADENSVTAISAKARIDYILRFGKQAILVVDELSENYSAVGSHFLGTLPNDHNAAFVSISAKFNDIQVRCRLTEQLYPDTLFDPEQSVAVTVLRLAKDKKTPTSIVIEHAHLLSLQMVLELCQLAEIANKSGQTINVLLLGQLKAAMLVATEKVLFNKKIAIVLATSGQLLSLDSKLLKQQRRVVNITTSWKYLIGLIVFTGVISAVLVAANNNDLFGFSELPELTANQQSQETEEFGISVSDDELKSTDLQTEPVEQASVADILQAIAISNNIVVKPVTEVAAVVDIVNALEAVPAQSAKVKTVAVPPVLSAVTIPSETTPTEQWQSDTTSTQMQHVNPQYYQHYFQQAKEGFAIQLAGFGSNAPMATISQEFSLVPTSGYYRLLRNEKYLVITSEIYATREQALQALAQLPEVLRNRGPWIKSIAAINDEIIAFESSQ